MFRTFRSAPVLVAGLGLTAMLSLPACGGGEPAGAAPSGGGGRSSANTDQLVEFAECLRGQGLDVPDPKPGQGLMQWVHDSGLDMSKFQSAAEACRDKLPAGVRDRLNSQQGQDYMLELARCMRRNGVDMPDPKGGHIDFGSVDRNSPEFRQALEKCREEVPRPEATR